MGSRSNVCVKSKKCFDHEIYLYSHWDGSDLAVTLKKALKRGKDRWEDPSYLTRIIFSEMIKNDVDGLTGYGISNHLLDNEYNILYVDTDSQTVNVGYKSFSFEEFIQLEDRDLKKLMCD